MLWCSPNVCQLFEEAGQVGDIDGAADYLDIDSGDSDL
jgi:hypothetical protein